MRPSKKLAQGKIEDFFRQDELDSEGVKKIKILAMQYNIKLGKHRKRFCKNCYYDLKRGKIRITKNYKIIECQKCGNKNKFKI